MHKADAAEFVALKAEDYRDILEVGQLTSTTEGIEIHIMLLLFNLVWTLTDPCCSWKLMESQPTRDRELAQSGAITFSSQCAALTHNMSGAGQCACSGTNSTLSVSDAFGQHQHVTQVPCTCGDITQQRLGY